MSKWMLQQNSDIFPKSISAHVVSIEVCLLSECRLVMIGHEYLWQAAAIQILNNFYYDHFKSQNSYTKLQLL